MAVLTLADYGENPSPLVAGVVKILREESLFMDILPIEDAGALNVEVIREGGMPTISWRRAGASHGSNKAVTPNRINETAYSFGNYVDVDKMYIKDKGKKLYDPRTYWTTMTVRAMAREFNDAAINGAGPSQPDRPTGLFYRILNDMAATQNIDAAAGSGLDISASAGSLAANIQQFFDRLDKLLYSMVDHKADYLLLNDNMLTRYWSVARQSNLLDTTTDRLGREFFSYKGAKLIDMGFKTDDTTKIITDAELANGTAVTGGAYTSIYAIRLGKDKFTAFQEYAMDVADLGVINDGVTYRLLVDWVLGLAVSHPRSISRLYGVKTQ